MLQVEESTDDSNACVVVVAYATSQKTAKVYPGEFVIEASALSGLTSSTKFDLLNSHALPFDDNWFGAATGTNPAHPRRGRLKLEDMAVKRKLQSAFSEMAASRKD